MPESQSIKIMDEINKTEGEGPVSNSQDQGKKKVDASWKQQVEKEKQGPKTQGEEFTPPEADFKFFITTLALQTSIALGHMANPATGKTEAEPAQAKFLIDTLGMLQEKTTLVRKRLPFWKIYFMSYG